MDGILILNPDETIASANEAAAALLGMDAASLGGQPLASLLTEVPPKPWPAGSFVLSLRGGAHVGAQLIGSHVLQLRPDQSPAMGSIPIELLARLAQDLSAASSAKEAAMAILDLADRLLGWDASYLMLYSREEHLYRHVVNIDTIDGVKAEYPQRIMGLNPTSMGQKTMDHGRQMVLLSGDQPNTLGLIPFGNAAQVSKSMLYVPIRRGSEHFGVLSIQSYKLNAYNQNDLDTLQILADYCTGALERVLAEARLRDQERLTQAFAELGQNLASAKTPREAGLVILNTADRLFGWDACFINVYAEETDVIGGLISLDTVDGQRVPVGPAYPDGKPTPMARRVLEQGAQLVVRRDDDAGVSLIAFGDTTRISKTLMFAPIRSGSRRVGIMSIQSYTPAVYTEKDLTSFQALADHCAGALVRTLAEYSLRKSEDLFRLVSQQIPSILWTVDAGLNFTLMLGEAARQLPDGAMVPGQGLEEFLCGEDGSEIVLETHLRALAGQSGSCELKRGGRIYDCHVEPLYDGEGLLIGCVNIGHDISERKAAEASLLRSQEELESRVRDRTSELLESNRRLQEQIAERERAENAQQRSLSLLKATLESTADAIVVTDRKGTVLMWNRNAREMWNLPDVLGEPDELRLEEIVLPRLRDPRPFDDRVKEMEDEPDATGFETLSLRDDRTIEATSKPQQIGSATVGRVWSFRDVTERRRAEETLLRSERTYREAIEATSGVPYRVRFDSAEYEFMGEGITRLLNISPKGLCRETLGDLVAQYEFLEPEAPTNIGEYDRAFRAGRVAQYRADLLVRLPDGTEKWVNDCSVPIRDGRTGAVTGSLGILQDITIRKRAEMEARLEGETQVRELEQENRMLKKHLIFKTLENPQYFSEIITTNEAMRIIFRYVESVGRTDQPVLVYGETGVGKELMARAIHRASGRTGPFMPINVAGLDDEMFSDTLFGHMRGAFTGAMKDRRGLVEAAANGTLFLDEIGDLALTTQVKLLRLLQEREYYQIGADTPKTSSARVVVATNQDLKQLIQAGRFRKDLFYRLQTHKIEIPALRDRREDIALLTDHFLEKAARQLGRKTPTAPKELCTLLQNYAFPGNIRELESMIFDAVSKHESNVMSLEVFYQRIRQEHGLGMNLRRRATDGQPVVFTETLPTLKESTEALIAEALRRSQNNQSMAARMLGVTQQALNRRIRRKADKGWDGG